MVTIAFWEIELPEGLQFLANMLGSVALTFLFWLISAWILSKVILRFFKWLARHTPSDVDDVLLSAIDKPLVYLLVTLGLQDSFARIDPANSLTQGAVKMLGSIAILVVTYSIYRVFKDVLLYYGERLARSSESRLDDVLMPIINRLAPIIIFGTGLAVTLQYNGMEMGVLLAAIGGISFILAFALQDILSNIFSGLSMVIDTPFAYRDLLTLADGTICEVRRIGLRVTELYDINTHSTIYMPNSQLANERLVNMNRPSPNLIDTLSLSVDLDTDPDLVTTIMEEVVFGHPDVLGELDIKLNHLPHFVLLEAAEAKRENGRARLEIEKTLDKALSRFFTDIHLLVLDVRGFEKRGIDNQEREILYKKFDQLIETAGLQVEESQSLRRSQFRLGPNFDNSTGIASLTRVWISTWADDPDLLADDHLLEIQTEELWDHPLLEDLQGDAVYLVDQWRQRVGRFSAHMTDLYVDFHTPGRKDQRLDDELLNFEKWMRAHFKQPFPAWKGPDVNFEGYDDRGLAFTVEFFIDSIELEHFERQERVERELRREVVRRFREAGIQVAFERRTVNLLRTNSELRV